MNLNRRQLTLRKNDQVQVIAGSEKGKIGKILKIYSKTQRVTVENMNLAIKHVKRTAESAGKRIEKPLPIHYSNLLLMCQKCNRGVRHGYEFQEKEIKKNAEGFTKKNSLVKVRVCKQCKTVL